MYFIEILSKNKYIRQAQAMMEMCYDGALVMPSNYAVISEDEMMYVVNAYEKGFAY